MPIYVEGEYFSILTQIVREDRVVPFDCYLYLRANGRAVCLVKKHEPFEKAKLDKLHAYKIKDLYVKQADQGDYEGYLRSFFQTDEGKAAFKEAYDQAQGGPVNGIPDAIASEFEHLKNGPDAEAPAEVTVTGPASLPESETTVRGTVAEPEPETLVESPEEVRDEIVQLLRQEAENLDDQLVAGSALTPEERQLIRDATAKVDEELLKVRGQKDKDPAAVKIVVQGATQKIREQIERVAGISGKEGRQYKALQQQVEELKVTTSELVKISSATAPSADLGYQVADLVDATEEDWTVVRNLAEAKNEKTVSNTVGKIIAGLEQVLGAKLEIKHLGAPPEEAAPGENGPVSAAVKDKIESQNQIIFDLNKRLKTTQSAFKDLTAKWNEFQAQTHKKFDDTDKMAAKSLGVHLMDLQTIYLATKGESDQILSASDELCKDIGISSATAKTPALPPAAAGKPASPEGASRHLSLELPSEASATAGEDELRAENQLLRSQLVDAKALIDNNNQNIGELKGFVDQSEAYAKDIEADRKASKEEVEKLRERVQLLETGTLSLEEVANSAKKIVTRSKSELQTRDGQIQQLKEQVQMLSDDLKLYKDKFAGIELSTLDLKKDPDSLPIPGDVLALIKQKDQMIERLRCDLETRLTELKALEKENAQQKNKFEESSNLKKRMAHKYERLENEKEGLRREFESLNRKVISSVNLLETERKTITKLTQLIEELKRDRVDFMNKTNLAMKGHKDIISKASNLNTQMQNELERHKKTQGLLSDQKHKATELMAKLAEESRMVKVLHHEIDALRKQLARSARTRKAA